MALSTVSRIVGALSKNRHGALDCLAYRRCPVEKPPERRAL
jgi:hypothetical protein